MPRGEQSRSLPYTGVKTGENGSCIRPVLYLKNLKIYFSQDLRFSSFFLLCYPKLEKKSQFFFLSIFGVSLTKFFCEVNPNDLRGQEGK